MKEFEINPNRLYFLTIILKINQQKFKLKVISENSFESQPNFEQNYDLN